MASNESLFPILTTFFVLFFILLLTSKTCYRIMLHLEREKDLFIKDLFRMDEQLIEEEERERKDGKKKEKKKKPEESDEENEGGLRKSGRRTVKPENIRPHVQMCDKIIQINPIDFMIEDVGTPFRPYYVPNAKLYNKNLLYLHGTTLKSESYAQTDPIQGDLTISRDHEMDKKLRTSRSRRHQNRKKRRRRRPRRGRSRKGGVRKIRSSDQLSVSPLSPSIPSGSGHVLFDLLPEEPSVCSGDYNLMEYVCRPLQYIFDTRVRDYESFEQWQLKKSQVLKNTSRYQRISFSLKSMSRFPFHLLEMKNLTHVDFSRNLFSFLPRWFFTSLKELTILNLSHNYLYEIPEDISGCPYLKEVNFSHNRIQYFPFAFIKSSFKSLSMLNLSHNLISVLPYNIYKMRSLTHLDLSNNVLVYLPVSILKMRGSLKQLNVKNNLFMYEVQSTIIDKFSTSVRQLSPEDGIGTGIRGGEYFSYSSPRLDDRARTASSVTGTGGGDERPDGDDGEGQGIGHRERKEELVHELVGTELSYLKMLNVFHKLYYHPLVKDFKDTRRRYNLYEMSDRQKSLLIPDEIQDIIKFERRFFGDLKREFERFRGRDIVLMNIFKIFDRHMKDLEKYYVNYPFIFQISRISITKLRTKLKDLRKFLERKQKLPMSQGHRLEDFLLLPLNRLHIYHYFLQRYYRCVSEEEKLQAKQTINNMKMLYNSGKEVIFRMNNKYRMEEIQSKLKMKKLYNEKRILRREGDLLLSPTKEVAVFKKKLAKSIGWDVGGTVTNTANLFKGQINSLFDKSAGEVVRGLFNTRLLEYYVHLYMFNDRLIWEYNNIWTSSFYRLFGKVHSREMKDLKRLEPNIKEASFTLIFGNNNSNSSSNNSSSSGKGKKKKKDKKNKNVVSFVARNEEQALLWTEAIQDCMEEYQKDHPEFFVELSEDEEEEEGEDEEDEEDDEEEGEEEEDDEDDDNEEEGEDDKEDEDEDDEKKDGDDEDKEEVEGESEEENEDEEEEEEKENKNDGDDDEDEDDDEENEEIEITIENESRRKKKKKEEEDEEEEDLDDDDEDD